VDYSSAEGIIMVLGAVILHETMKGKIYRQ
jgi:hypothetical protein